MVEVARGKCARSPLNAIMRLFGVGACRNMTSLGSVSAPHRQPPTRISNDHRQIRLRFSAELTDPGYILARDFGSASEALERMKILSEGENDPVTDGKISKLEKAIMNQEKIEYRLHF